MQDKLVYEYAVIRIVPKVERGEFVNAGIILLCKQKRFIKVKFQIDEQRILSLSPLAAIEIFQKHLTSFEEICIGSKNAGLIGSLPIHERFRWLTAKRSTIIQCSPVHGGISHNLEETFDHLYNEYVTI